MPDEQGNPLTWTAADVRRVTRATGEQHNPQKYGINSGVWTRIEYLGLDLFHDTGRPVIVTVVDRVVSCDEPVRLRVRVVPAEPADPDAAAYKILDELRPGSD